MMDHNLKNLEHGVPFLMPGILSKVVVFLNVVSLFLHINVLSPHGLSSVFTCQNVTEGIRMSHQNVEQLLLMSVSAIADGF